MAIPKKRKYLDTDIGILALSSMPHEGDELRNMVVVSLFEHLLGRTVANVPSQIARASTLMIVDAFGIRHQVVFKIEKEDDSN